MKISELIQHLEHMQQEHGDLELAILSIDGSRGSIEIPQIDHKAILNSREYKQRFASYYKYDASYEHRKGEKVCRID